MYHEVKSLLFLAGYFTSNMTLKHEYFRAIFRYKIILKKSLLLFVLSDAWTLNMFYILLGLKRNESLLL